MGRLSESRRVWPLILHQGAVDPLSSPQPSSGSLPPVVARWPGLLLVWICVLAFVTAGRAAEAPVPIERTVKAAFVYKFLSFGEWPTDVFTAPDAPLIIGVYNADDIANELSPMVRDRLVGSHPV